MMKCIKLNETKPTIAASTRKRGPAVLGAVEQVKDSLFHL